MLNEIVRVGKDLLALYRRHRQRSRLSVAWPRSVYFLAWKKNKFVNVQTELRIGALCERRIRSFGKLDKTESFQEKIRE